jgi:release factor glutamine methyltransferase
MAEVWTVRRLIDWISADLTKRLNASARLDADLLVAHALGMKRIGLYLDLERPLTAAELAAVRALVERRRKHEPMAYILGEREFYGRPFTVNRDVLIPRPDTETLVERALAALSEGGRLLDLCTGSGAVVISLLAERPALHAVASDLSARALEVAAANASRHGVNERLTLRQGDLWSVLQPDERFSCITANPPYIGAVEIPELAPDVRDHEPHLALDAGADALSFYRRIAAEAPQRLEPGGVVCVEVGIHQAEPVAELFRTAGLEEVRATRDLAGIERVVEARSPAREPT